MTTQLTLNNGVTMPAIGLGVFQTPPDETTAAVVAALETGYRHIDTAAAYGNEREVGEGIRRSGIARDEVFIETKVWISDYGYDETLHAFDKSAAKLGVEQLDLLILHQALPSHFDTTIEAYRALETLLADGRVRAIGVSNFMRSHLDELAQNSSVVPAVNQIELHPMLNQAAMRAVNADRGIVTEAYGPLGVGRLLDNQTIVSIAEARGKSPAQVLIRWSIQLGNVVIPRSSSPERIKSNLDVFDFELTDDEMATLNGLDDGTRFRPDPETYTGT